MQSSGQPEPDDRDSELDDVPIAIPALARAWESAHQVKSAVRRPSTFPDPESYHEIIEPEAIFELEESQEDGSIKTIYVVPFSCKRCISSKQACSRARPACARCRKARSSCEVPQDGYQRLPRPKIQKRSLKVNSTASSASWGMTSFSKADPFISAPSIASGSKRMLSPGPDPAPPRKKTLSRRTSRGGKKARCPTAAQSQDMDLEYSQAASASASPGEPSALRWTFVKSTRKREKTFTPGQEHLHSMLSNTRIPRVWTNSLDGLLTVFPQLAKVPVGLSWFQSDTPILLLDTNYAQGHWIDSTTLSIDLLWDFVCYDSELEPIVESDAGDSTQPHPTQPVACPPESTLDCKVDTMGQRYSPPRTRLSPTRIALSAPLLPRGALPSDGVPSHEGDIYENAYENRVEGGTLAMQDDSASTVRSTQPYPSSPLSSVDDSPPPCLHPAPSGPVANHVTYQTNFRPRIPLTKPPEVETLLDSHHRFIPLLLWIPHHSGLVPCSLAPEFAYLCMGLFFVSDLRHTAIQYSDSSIPGVAQGQVCWSVTLQWAPGGEDVLFDCGPATSSDTSLDSTQLNNTQDLLHPWWFDPTDAVPQADNTNPYHSRISRTQLFSFIPLDLLADFHPSESFPRGWFCKSCGMINIQEFFRHQICRSSICGTVREKRIPEGKVDPLSSLRDPYQSSTLVRPIDKIPSVVVSDGITWDDGMQSWICDVRDGVRLCHVFTGNQDHLQEDATDLLERIQREVLLRKEDTSSPYFTHTTKLSHPNDGSATVPGGTPDCIRIAYYTLRDFVHRYAEMDTPRFGMVRIQAWTQSGSKRGTVFRASKSPVVIHCLGVEAVLNLTPKGGYKEAAQSTAIDKGKGKARAEDESRPESPPAEPYAGPSGHPLEQDNGNLESFISAAETNESPIVTEHADADEAAATMDTVLQYPCSNDGGVAMSNSNASYVELGMEVAEPKPGRVRKKNKVTKDKSKTSVPEISMTLVHGDCVILCGDDFECQIVRVGTTVLVMGFPEGT